MKKKFRISIFQILATTILFLIMYSCNKDSNSSSGNNIIFNPTVTYSTFTDSEKNVYKVVTIGTQTWMAENLKVSRFRNGNPIPNVTDGTAWTYIQTGAYCEYNNDPLVASTYGKLYNWYAVTDSRNLAPIGWHVATKADWTTLISYLGGDSTAGGPLKEIGTTHWFSPNVGATNKSGFSAIPGGYRFHTGSFLYIGDYGYFWTSDGWQYHLDCFNNFVENNGTDNKNSGYSVRCVKD
jgi:uncharacterized protein (TIGR02145 family)